MRRRAQEEPILGRESIEDLGSMANEGLDFLAKVLQIRLTTCLSDLDESFFVGEEEHRVYQFICNFLRDHRVLPSSHTLLQTCRVDLSEERREPVSYYREQLELRKIRSDLAATLEDVSIQLQRSRHNPREALDTARVRVNQLSRTMLRSSLQSIQELVPQVVADYEVRRDTPGLQGIPTGWPTLDVMTQGIQPSDFIAIVGRVSRGKTSLLMKLAQTAYQDNRRVLVVSFEMPLLQMGRRLLAGMLHLPYTNIRTGRLSVHGEDRLRNATTEVLGNSGQLHFLMAGFHSGFDTLYAVLRDLRPDILFLDGAAMLRPSNVGKNASSWETVSATARELRSLSLSENLPIVSSFHFNRKVATNAKGASMEDIGLTDEIPKVATMVLGVFRPDEDDVTSRDYSDRVIPPSERNAVDIRLLKGREGERGSFRVNFDYHRMDFSEILSEDRFRQPSESDLTMRALREYFEDRD